MTNVVTSIDALDFDSPITEPQNSEPNDQVN